ncbi:MAG: hypothetical protein OXC48_09545 [Endozoicomonadaceae bacterium]|nr:hypothetical protein [Endozoicomonadaceae bacterium]
MEINTTATDTKRQLSYPVETVQADQSSSGIFAGRHVSVQTEATRLVEESTHDLAAKIADNIRTQQLKSCSPTVAAESSPSAGNVNSAFATDSQDEESDDSENCLNKTLNLPVHLTAQASRMSRPFINLWYKFRALQHSDQLPKKPTDAEMTPENKQKALNIFLQAVDLRSKYLGYLDKYKDEVFSVQSTSKKIAEQQDNKPDAFDDQHLKMHYEITVHIIHYTTYFVRTWLLYEQIFCGAKHLLSANVAHQHDVASGFVTPSTEASANLNIITLYSYYPKIWNKKCSLFRHFAQFLVNVNYSFDQLKRETPCSTINQEQNQLKSVVCSLPFIGLLKTADDYLFSTLEENTVTSVPYIIDRLNIISYQQSKTEDLSILNTLLHCIDPLLCKTDDYYTENIFLAIDALLFWLNDIKISEPPPVYWLIPYFSELATYMGFTIQISSIPYPPYYISVLTRLVKIRQSWVENKKEQYPKRTKIFSRHLDILLQRKKVKQSDLKIEAPVFVIFKQAQKDKTVQGSTVINADSNNKEIIKLPALPVAIEIIIHKWNQNITTSQTQKINSPSYRKKICQLEKLSEEAKALNEQQQSLTLNFSNIESAPQNIKDWKQKAEDLLTRYTHYLKVNPEQLCILRNLSLGGSKTLNILKKHASLQSLSLAYSDGLSTRLDEKKTEILKLTKEAIEGSCDITQTATVITGFMDDLVNHWLKRAFFSICHLKVCHHRLRDTVEDCNRNPVIPCFTAMIFLTDLYEEIRQLKPASHTEDAESIVRWQNLESTFSKYLGSGAIKKYFDLIDRQRQSDSPWSENKDFMQAVALLAPYFCNQSTKDICYKDYLNFSFNPEKMPFTVACMDIILSMAQHSFQYHLNCLENKQITKAQWKHAKENLVAITQFIFDGSIAYYWLHFVCEQSITQSWADKLFTLIRNNQIISTNLSPTDSVTHVSQKEDELFDSLDDKSAVSKVRAKPAAKSSFTAPTAAWRTESENSADQQELTAKTEIKSEEDQLFFAAERLIGSQPVAAIEQLQTIHTDAIQQNNTAVTDRAVISMGEAAAQIIYPLLKDVPKNISNLTEIEEKMDLASANQTYILDKQNYDKLMEHIRITLDQHAFIIEAINHYQAYLESATNTCLITQSESLSPDAVKAIKDKCKECKTFIKQYMDYLSLIVLCMKKRMEVMKFLKQYEHFSETNPERQVARQQNTELVERAKEAFTKTLREFSA